MTTEFDIRRSVARYLGGEADVRDLRADLVPLSGSNMLTPEALSMLRHIEGRLAEFSEGDWDDAELRSLLNPFGVMVILDEPPQRVDSNADIVGEAPQREAVTMFS